MLSTEVGTDTQRVRKLAPHLPSPSPGDHAPPSPATSQPYPQPSSGDPNPGVQDFQQSPARAGGGARQAWQGEGVGALPAPSSAPVPRQLLKGPRRIS